MPSLISKSDSLRERDFGGDTLPTTPELVVMNRS